MKKFRSKKQRRKISLYKIAFLLAITFFFYYFFTQLLFDFRLATNNQEFITYLLEDSNHHLKYNKTNRFWNDVLNKILNIDVTKPTTILKNTYGVEEPNKDVDLLDEEFTDEESTVTTDYVYDPNPNKIADPAIYIYNTHQLENYDGTDYSENNITPNVLMASYLLKEKLNKNNIQTVAETANLKEFMNINGWSYNYSYQASRYFIKEAISNYQNLKLLIDLHRDSISKDKSTVTIGNKNYAKILFVVGQDYEGYEKNLEIANKINQLVKSKYPTLSRGIITKSGPNVNGIYNQDVKNGMVLIELGGNENTMEEVVNTIDVIAEILTEYIGE